MQDLKLERCGYCGSFFRGKEYIFAEELSKISKQDLDEAPLGYCSNAQAEHYEQNPEPQNYVTRDMAIDAGDLSLEGQRY